MDEQNNILGHAPNETPGGCGGCGGHTHDAGCCADAKTGGGCCGGCGSSDADLCVTQTDAPDVQTAMERLTDELIAIPDPEPLPAPPAKITVVDIHFRSGGKIYFFDPDGLSLHMGDHVIIDTARGPEYGICASGNHAVAGSEIVAPLRKVLRTATEQDEKIAADNREKEKKAMDVCQQKITEHKLDMQLVSAECAFDGSKILFFFTADGRVDFRELVKNLASVFRTRIELRQIGVRDKAKMVGGLGVCGLPFCCSQFLDDFQPVSIKMAKTQNLSLNPAKISGTCGRLMCCLKYEQEAYEDLLKTSPKPESFVDTPDGRGTVCDVSLLRQSVRVRMEDHYDTINTYRNEDIAVLRNGKAKKSDPPIPRDIAPISSLPRVAREKKQPEPTESTPSMFKRLDNYATAPAALQPSAPTQAPGRTESAEADPEKTRNRRRRRRGGSGPKPEGAATPQAPAQQEPPRQSDPKPQPQSADAEPGDKARSANRRRRYRNHKPKEGGGPPQS